MLLKNLLDLKEILSFEENKNTDLNIDIETLFIDSRKVVKNGLFFCIKGRKNDSHRFIKSAIEHGAKAIAYSEEPREEDMQEGISYVKVKDGTSAMSYAVDKFYNSPSKKLDIYTVTGTNGKTSTSYLTCEILSHFENTAYNGTIGHKVNGVLHVEGHMTTPDNLALNRLMYHLLEEGVKSFALEVSSHALDQHRVDYLDVDVAVFTNLTHEHLDYHHSMEEYKRAKQRLFTMLKSGAVAIINYDDSYSRDFIDAAKTNEGVKIFTYGESADADYRFFDIELFPNQTKFKLEFQGQIHQITTNILGKLNVYNLTAAIISVHQGKLKIAMEDIIPILTNMDFTIGRLDYIGFNEEEKSRISEDLLPVLPNVIVDYAHTPDAFLKVFEFISHIVKHPNKAVCVFGSAGDRDRTKRPVMGEIADKYSDIIIITEDDFREESPKSIAEEIKSGILNKEKVSFISNREDAIAHAITISKKGDCVILLGKGNDRYMATEKGDVFYESDSYLAKKYLLKKANLHY